MARAASRIAVCDIETLLESMPGYAERSATLMQFASVGEDRLEKLELNMVEYSQQMQAKLPGMNEKQRSKSEAEMLKLQDELDDARDRFDREFEGKRKQQLGPLLQRLEAAVEAVAQAHEYTHVLNSSAEFPSLIYVKAEDRIDELVVAELEKTSGA